MSDLSVGSLVTSGTTTYVSGTSSGLDTDSLVENAVAANNEKADQIDIRIDENLLKIEGYNEYYSLAQSVQDSLSSLKSITSRSETETSVFDQRTGILSSNGTDPEGLLSATIDEGAEAGEYDITVVQKAEEMIVQSQNIASQTDALGYEGTFTIGLSGNNSESVEITTDMSLQDIADAINAVSDSSDVSASILKVSEDTYQLVLEGSQTNKSIEVFTSFGTVLSDLGFTDGADNFLTSQITQEPQGSIILFNSTEVSRDDNTYDDLIKDVSFTIKGADEETTITLSVDNDTSSAKEAILGFIDAYNALRDFFLTNQTVNSDGSIPDDAALFSDTMLETLSSDLARLLGGTSYDDSDVQTIRDLGIVFDDENKLVLDDETALDDALLDSFEDVAQFFSTKVETSNSQLGVISNTSTSTSLAFEISISLDGNGDISSAIVNGAGNVFQIDGNRLIGRDGTAYEGLTLAYVGTADATISVSMTAGLADLVYNTIEPYTDAANGLIQTEISQLQGTNDELETEAEEIWTRGEEIREREIERYSKMEAKLEIAKNLMAQIQAILGTDSSE